MRKAVYYDRKYGVSVLIDDRLYKETPKDYEVLDYFSIADWLDKAGRGDLLVFAQDVVPYTAYDVALYSYDSKLLRFLQRGGTVVWVGEAPFYYRLHCFEREMKDKLNKAKEALRRSVSYTPVPEFYLQKFGPYERGDKVCIFDIIIWYYVDLVDPVDVRWIGYDYKHLTFYKLRDVCDLREPVQTETTFTGMVLGYDSKLTVRPTKHTTRIYPLTVTRLSGIGCSGRYAGSWFAEVSGGVFVRLYDVVSEINAEKVFKIGERVASLRGG